MQDPWALGLSAQVKGKDDERRDGYGSCEGERDKAVQELEIRATGLVLLAISAAVALGLTHT